MILKTSVQSLHYLCSKLNKPIGTMKALKLIYFADRYHLRKYARFITDDTYYAMEKGTVASATYDLLKNLGTDNDLYTPADIKYINNFLKKSSKYEYTFNNKNIDYDMLSETDKEALDFALDNFGNKTKDELSDITHDYPEWYRYENSFKNNLIKRENIKIEDFFKNPDLKKCKFIKKDFFDIIDSDIVELSKEFYFGNLN